MEQIHTQVLLNGQLAAFLLINDHPLGRNLISVLVLTSLIR